MDSIKMYIARNQDGSLWLHEEKPSLVYDEESRNWYYECGSFLDFYDESIFPEVTFENSPMEVELVIKRQKMKLMLYTKAPFLWTPEEWRMTTEEREFVGIKLAEVDLN